MLVVYILETFGGIVCSTRGVCKGRANTFGFVCIWLFVYILYMSKMLKPISIYRPFWNHCHQHLMTCGEYVSILCVWFFDDIAELRAKIDKREFLLVKYVGSSKVDREHAWIEAVIYIYIYIYMYIYTSIYRDCDSKNFRFRRTVLKKSNATLQRELSYRWMKQSSASVCL